MMSICISDTGLTLDLRLVSPLPGEATESHDENRPTTTPEDLIHRTQLDLCVLQAPEGTDANVTSEGTVDEVGIKRLLKE